MKIHGVLLFCFSSAAILNGNNGVINAQSNRYTKMKGENFFQSFDLKVPVGSRKYLCRNDCRKEDVLVETHGKRLISGRYGIRYDSSDRLVHVTITGLTNSDTGRYKVGVSASSLDSHKEFGLEVRDPCDGADVFGEHRVYSAAEGGNLTITCSLFSHPRNRKFLCREDCDKFLFDTNDVKAASDKYEITYGNNSVFKVTIMQLTKSDSGRYRCGVGRAHAANLCQKFEITVTGGGALRPLVCLTIVFLLAACALLLYKQRTRIVDYVNTRETAGTEETQPPIYDDCAAVSTYETSTYQELDPGSRDHTVYCSIQT